MTSTKQFVHSNQTMAIGVDKGLIKMFLKMTPEERILSNDNAVKAIMELRNAFKQHIEFQGFKIHVLSLDTIIALKKDSKRPEDQYRLQILEETLRQMKKK